jgi:hypothetical protein
VQLGVSFVEHIEEQGSVFEEEGEHVSHLCPWVFDEIRACSPPEVGRPLLQLDRVPACDLLLDVEHEQRPVG